MSRFQLPRAWVRATVLGVLLAGALGVGQASAATKVKRPASSPSFYTLGNARAKCRTHYSKQTVSIRVRRHGHSVRIHQVRCVYTGSKSLHGAPPSFPTNLPTAAVSVTVIPGANDSSYSIAAGQTLNVGGLGVLEGAAGSGLSAVLLSATADGVLTLNHNGTFRYTPASGFSGVDHFSYKDAGASGESSTPATVTIHVTPVAAAVGPYAVPSAGTLSVGAPGVLAGDLGTGVKASLVSGVAGGSLSLNADGSFSYTARAGFAGSDSFTFEAVDSSSQDSGPVTVTIVVGVGPPSVVAQSFSGAVGNTELQVGGTRGSGPEVYRGSANALAGDSDPNGGTLSVTAANITTAHGGTVALAADGTFVYQPPVAFSGPSDTFSYKVNASEGTSALASATINFTGARVWYVNNALGAGGNGTSASPFDSLAAVSSGGAAGSGDELFLFAGSGPYTGGVVLAANQTLVGQSVGLNVGSDALLVPSGGNPVITNAGGVGVTLANGDTVSGLDVNNTAAAGFGASGVDTFTLEGSVSITGAGGDGLSVSGGNGTASVGATISGSVGHSVAIQNRTGGTVTLSGPITDAGAGLSITNDGGATINFSGTISANTGAAPAFTATGGGTVSATSSASTLSTTSAKALDVEAGTLIGAAGLTFQSISAGTSTSGPSDGVLISGAGTGALSVLGTGSAGSGGTIQHTIGTGGAADGGVSVSNSGPVSLNNMTLSANAGAGVYASSLPSLAVLNSTVSGAGPGDGIHLSSDGTLNANLAGNTVQEIGPGSGILAATSGTGTLDLTLSGNHVAMGSTSSQSGVTIISGGDGGAGTVCVKPTGNTVSAASGGPDAMRVEQVGTSSTFAIDGYSGAPTDLSAVESFLGAGNTLSGGSGAVGVAGARATLAGSNLGFTEAACQPVSLH